MKKNGFEKDLKELENIVARLEADEVSLEDAMDLFEKGIKLSRLCSKRLDQAENRIEILIRDKEGRIKTEPFENGEV